MKLCLAGPGFTHRCHQWSSELSILEVLVVITWPLLSCAFSLAVVGALYVMHGEGSGCTKGSLHTWLGANRKHRSGRALRFGGTLACMHCGMAASSRKSIRSSALRWCVCDSRMKNDRFFRHPKKLKEASVRRPSPRRRSSEWEAELLALVPHHFGLLDQVTRFVRALFLVPPTQWN